MHAHGNTAYGKEMEMPKCPPAGECTKCGINIQMEYCSAEEMNE